MPARIRPERLVSLAPALTELVFALGAGERLVGVSDYCDLPDHSTVLRLGGPGNPDLDALSALQPDLVLVDRSPGSAYTAPPIDVDLPVFGVCVRSVGGLIDQIRALAEALGMESDAASLLAGIQTAIDQAYTRQMRLRLKRVVAFIWRDPWLAVGGDTYADDLLRLCAAENIALRLPGRSPRASLEAFMRYNPQVILLVAGGPIELSESDRAAFWRFGDVDAVLRKRVHVIDARLLTRYGTRTAEAIEVLTQLVHS